jgi:hypothetical protein
MADHCADCAAFRLEPVMTTDETGSIEQLRAEIAALEQEIDTIYREAVRHDQELVALQDSANALDYSTSEHRLLSTRGPYIHSYYHHLRQFWRNVALLGEIQGSGADHRQPPRELPPDVRLAFTMGGQVPVLDAYFAARCPPHFEVVFTDGQVAALRDDLGLAEKGTAASHYARAVNYLTSAPDPLRPALKHYLGPGTGQGIGQGIRQGMRVAVCGSTAPVYEALCLEVGASPTSLGFGPIRSETSLIATMPFADALSRAERFDHVVAGWVVPQAGMGRFDAIDPDADLKLMRALLQLVAADGRLIVGVPIGPDVVAYNTGRVYGPLRLPLLLDGWEEVARRTTKADASHEEVVQAALILRPARNSGAASR